MTSPKPIGLVCVVLFVISGQTYANETVTTAHVHQNVGTLLNEIEQIRLVLGKRLPRSREFRLQDAEPRQVYFQAQTLFRKCNTLAQELAGISRQSPPSAPESDIDPKDVMDLVEAARTQLSFVRAAINITEPATTPRLNTRRKSSDVMHDIIQAGYVLNQLTTQTIDWSQIYDRVYQAVTYVGGALPADVRYPQLEAFVCCKMPQDVSSRLVATMTAASPKANSVGLKLVRITSIKQSEGGASTETVYDLTTTLVSDLGELTLRLEGEDVAGPDYPRPARIYPSHVFQLAGVLERQVQLLSDG